VFVCLFVCTVTDFSAEDKASGVKFCTAVHRRQMQGMSHFGELCSPRSPKKSDDSASAQASARATRDGRVLASWPALARALAEPSSTRAMSSRMQTLLYRDAPT